MPPALPEVGACRRWLLSQIALQLQGSTPEPWNLPEPDPHAGQVMQLRPEERATLEIRTDALIVADENNRIVYANPALHRLLGWEHEGLNGRRLTTIVPPELREAHLAGFTHFLLTRETTIVGRPVVVPARRADASTIAVELTISVDSRLDGRRLLRATLRPIDLLDPS